MRFQIAPTSARPTSAPNVSAALIGDWADRVMDLWEDTRETASASEQPSQELQDACLVRDQLHNRLEMTHQGSSVCAERSLDVLRSADALFRQFTTESTTAAELSAHNHYAHRGEWWWRRLPRQSALAV